MRLPEEILVNGMTLQQILDTKRTNPLNGINLENADLT